MSGRKPRDLAASVRHRLHVLSQTRGEDLQLVLTRYGLERLLYRLTQSSHAGQFILKGAVLFQLWTGQQHRPTRDLDLLGQGSASPERLQDVFRDVCSIAVTDDGLHFPPHSVRGEQIKEEDEYQGIRLRLEARLANVRIPLQIDIGFGDAITPAPETVTFPTTLDFPAPALRAYPRETVVAEKFQAMVQLGMINSRMKDFYDLWTLARQFAFEGVSLSAAIQATFDRRNTRIPAQLPTAFTAEFTRDRGKATQWTAFLKKSRLVDGIPPTLSEIAETLETFLMPPTVALQTTGRFDQTWRPTAWAACDRARGL